MADLCSERLMDDVSGPSNGVIDSLVSCSSSLVDYSSFYLDVSQYTAGVSTDY